MKYHINEGSIQLPHAFDDRTMQVLIPEGSGVGFNLVITRDPLEPGETPSGYLNRQMDDLRRQVTKYQETLREPVHLGGKSQGIEGVCLEVHYKQQGKFLYHRQGVFALPNHKQMLTLTASSAAMFTEAQRHAWSAIVASFELRG